MAGTSPIAQAAMMDGTTPDERGPKMSQVVLVNCVVLVAGPAVGGLLGHLDFRAPLLVALLLCAGAFAWIYRCAAPDEGSGILRLAWSRPVEIAAQAWRHPAIRGLSSAFFLFQLGFGIYYVYIMVFMARAYHVSTATLGLFSTLMGVGFVVGSTVGYARAKRRLGTDERVARRALFICGVFTLLAALPVGPAAQWVIAAVICISNVPAFVALLTLISGAARSDEQGWALGIGASMTALAFFVAGLAALLLPVVPVAGLIAVGGAVVIAAMLPVPAGATPLATPQQAG